MEKNGQNRRTICKIPIVFETADEIEKNGVVNAYMRSVELRFVVFSRWFCHFSAGLGNPALRSQGLGIRNLEFGIITGMGDNLSPAKIPQFCDTSP